MHTMETWYGPAAAATAAMLWAIASALFEHAGHKISARVLNMTKGLIASVLLGVTLAVLGIAPPTQWSAVGWLILSGVIGLGLGDTAFFISLRCIGLRQVLLLQLLAPIFTGLIAIVWPGEILPAMAWAGIAVTLGGLGWVIRERRSQPLHRGGRGDRARGLIFGLIAALSQSVGAVISRQVMLDPQVAPMWTALIRLLSGALVLVPIILIWRGNNTEPQRHKKTKKIAGENAKMISTSPRFIANAVHRLGARTIGAVLLATVLGTYFAVWLQQVSFKYTEAAAAQTLLSLSPLFALPVAAIRGERLTWRSIFGAVVATAGVALFLGNQALMSWIAKIAL